MRTIAYEVLSGDCFPCCHQLPPPSPPRPHGRVSIRAGTSFHDLRELEVKELTEPTGWVVFALRGADDRPLRTYHVQIAVITNHQNGRDTHMRQVRVHAPVEQRGVMVDPLGSFVSVDCSQFACIR